MESIISNSCVENNLSAKEELQFRKKIKIIFLDSSKETIIELMNHDKYKLVLSSMMIYLIQQKNEKKDYINSNLSIGDLNLSLMIDTNNLSKFVQQISKTKQN